MFWLLAILTAYLAGSIPFGYLIGRARGIDIREHGSRNIGATNVGRVLGPAFGGLCFTLDMLKGAVPVLIAGQLAGLLGTPVSELSDTHMLLWLGVAMATVLGHMYSPLLGFGGGKGVATAFGSLLAMWPILTFPVLGAFVVWFAAVRMTRYVSLASMLAALSVPLFLVLWLIPAEGSDIGAAVLHAWPPLLLTVLLALLVVYKHRGNIARLRRGEEPKLGRKQRVSSSGGEQST